MARVPFGRGLTRTCQLAQKLAEWGRVRAGCLYRLLTGIIGAVLGWGLSVGVAAEATR
jgi:hypothetical protein